MAAVLDTQMAGDAEPSVFCIESWPKWMVEQVVASSCDVVAAFDKPGSFTRWLFEQPRGLGTPQSRLLCGWREAKPCADALLAAISGDTASLRPDNKRPPLMPVRPGTGEVPVAIHRIIVLVERNRKGAATEWAKAHPTIQVSVVSTMKDLTQALALPEAKAAARAPARAGEARAAAPARLFGAAKTPVTAGEARTKAPMGFFEPVKPPAKALEALAAAPGGLFRPPPGLPVPWHLLDVLAAARLTDGFEAEDTKAPCYMQRGGGAPTKAPGLKLLAGPDQMASSISFPHALPSSLFWL